MPSLISFKFRHHMASQLLESFLEPPPTQYYMFIGTPTAFANDASPPTPYDMVKTVDYNYYRDMIAMKKISASDASFVIPRYNWTSGTVYKKYTDASTSLYPTSSSPTSNSTFYVLTPENNVYKCIDNHRDAPSTVKPTGISTSIITTSDGYRWKFLYKISSADALRFLTTNFMPVKEITSDDGSAQWAVQLATANGAINAYDVTSNGSSYLWISNTVSAVSNSTVIKLNNEASGTDDIYNKSTIYISSGLGAGQLRRIINYVGGTRTITVNGAFTTSPNTSSTYIVGPNVIIKGDAGALGVNLAKAYVSNCAGGQIRTITPINPGKHYSYANVSISANVGSGAVVNAIIDPKGGHGSNPVEELNGSSILLSVKLFGTESNTFPSNNEFRTIGILKDPKLRAGPSANASVIDQCNRITVTGLNGTLIADEVITGQTSGAQSRLVYFANTNGARTAGIVKTVHLTTDGVGKGYIVGETITGGTSGKVATVAAFTKPAVREYTGDIIYIENRTPTTRIANQVEDIKILLRF